MLNLLADSRHGDEGSENMDNWINPTITTLQCLSTQFKMCYLNVYKSTKFQNLSVSYTMCNFNLSNIVTVKSLPPIGVSVKYQWVRKLASCKRVGLDKKPVSNRI